MSRTNQRSSSPPNCQSNHIFLWSLEVRIVLLWFLSILWPISNNRPISLKGYHLIGSDTNNPSVSIQIHVEPSVESVLSCKLFCGTKAYKVRAFSHTSILSARLGSVVLLNSDHNSCLLKRKIIKMYFHGKINPF